MDASRGWAKRSRESSSSTTPSRAAVSSASTTVSRCPCAATTSSTVGRASAAAKSTTSPVSVGSRARRPPGARSGSRAPARPSRLRPGARPYELAAEFEGEERVARRCLLHPHELGPRQLESYPRTRRWWRAPRLSGPSGIRSSRSPANERSSSTGLPRRGRPDRREQAYALGPQAPERDLQHAG